MLLSDSTDSDLDGVNVSYVSKLHPYSRADVPVLTRFVACPVYSSSDLDNAHDPVGVLVFGDIVNGKAGTVEEVDRQFSNSKKQHWTCFMKQRICCKMDTLRFA